MRKILALGAAVVATLALVGGSTAAAVPTAATKATVDCSVNLCYPLVANSVASLQIVNNSVETGDIKTNTIGWTDFSATVQNLINAQVGTAKLADSAVTTPKVANGAVTGPKLDPALLAKINAPDVDTDVNGTSTVKAVYNDVTVDLVGGSWLTRKTDLGSFTLPAGTWVINTSAKFNRIVADETDPLYMTRPQLAVRAFPTEANPYGLDFGTVMNTIAPYADADMFGSDSHRVTLTDETTFTVAAFGYQDNRGSDDSGKIKVANATVFVQRG